MRHTDLVNIKRLTRGNAYRYIAYSLDYHHAGMWEDATGLLKPAVEERKDVYPMVCYYLAYFGFHQSKHERSIAGKRPVKKWTISFPTG